MALTINAIKSRIEEDLSSHPELRQSCLDIVNYLEQTQPPATRLAHEDFLAILGPEAMGERVIEAVQYLSGDRVRLLTTRFELVDDEGARYPINHTDVRLTLASGILLHPVTKTAVENPQEKIHLCFWVSKSLWQELDLSPEP